MKKKIFVAMLTALMLCACVISFVACGKEGEEEISDFERYRTDKFIETYTYLRTETEEWRDTYWKDEITDPILEDLYEIKNYKGPNKRIYAVQEFIELLGDKIVVSLNETNFTGTLGKMPSELIPYYSFISYLKLNPDETQKANITFNTPLYMQYHNPTQTHPLQNNVQIYVYFEEEIDSRRYRFKLVYDGYCTALAEYV
ncbi:MAG: hypothetical protein ACLUE6_08055 [Acutalibacteraceae bacterium]